MSMTFSRLLGILHRSRQRRIVATLVAFAFTLLASISATHLHIAADEDDGCALCVAFAGKLESPNPATELADPTDVAPAPPCAPAPSAPRVGAHVSLPPRCGPPPPA